MIQDSTQLIKKKELLDFNMTSGHSDSTRVTKNSRTTIYSAPQKLSEHATTDHYCVEIDLHIDLIKNVKANILYVEKRKKLQKQELKVEFN